MVRRKAKRKRSGPRQVSLLSVLQVWSGAEILMRGLTGYGPLQFITGEYDIGITPAEGPTGEMGWQQYTR